MGTWLALHVRWLKGGGTVTREQVTRLEGPAPQGEALRTALLEYRFGGWISAAGLVRGRRVQQLEQRAGAPTRYRTREEFSGLLTAFVPLAGVRDGFVRHARALKQRAELLAR